MYVALVPMPPKILVGLVVLGASGGGVAPVMADWNFSEASIARARGGARGWLLVEVGEVLVGLVVELDEAIGLDCEV